MRVLATETRVYVVADKHDGADVFLVRAASAAQAERFISNQYFEAKVATQDECIQLATKGVKVQEAKSEV